MGEFLFNLFLLLACSVFLIDSMSIQIIDGYVGARYWPMTFLALLVIMLLVKTFRTWKAIPAEERKLGKEYFSLVKSGTTKKFLLAVFTCLVYVLILPKLGFLLSTFIFGVAFSRILGAKKFVQNLLAGFVVSGPIFAVFVWGLNIRLPRGMEPFYGLSIWLERLF